MDCDLSGHRHAGTSAKNHSLCLDSLSVRVESGGGLRLRAVGRSMVSAKNGSSKIRIGIDVGGTFTHAVALDAGTLQVVGTAKLPTTHTAAQGVARGIVDVLELLLVQHAIAPGKVSFIAHSTTQATNALLEGDVASVGILGMGSGPNAWLAAQATRLGRIELSPGKFLTTYHQFVNTTRTPDRETIRKALEALKQAGAETIAVSEAFSVNQPDNEQLVLSIARKWVLLPPPDVKSANCTG